MFHVKFADIGEGIHEGAIFKMFVKKDQPVKEGENLFTLETDKVNAEIPSPVSGKVTEVKYKIGDKVKVGDVIVIIDDGTDRIKSNMEGPIIRKEETAASVVGSIEVSSRLISSSSEGMSIENTERKIDTKVLATPVARKMAKDLGVDIQTVLGSGTKGRVMKADIQKAAKNKPDTINFDRVFDKAIERIPMTMHRKTIAQNMVTSKFTIPHTVVMDEADVTELVAYRKKAKIIAENQAIKLTYMPFFIKAIVLALKEYKYLNASLDENTEEIILRHYFNIGIAVDTPEGLMVPVIKAADSLSIFELANTIEDLSARARSKALKLDELNEGTFTITNYGAVGAGFGVPIIRFPEAGILGVGAIVKKPVVTDEDEIVIRSILPLSLSFDHRIIDGGDAGRFVMVLKNYLSNPDRLVLS